MIFPNFLNINHKAVLFSTVFWFISLPLLSQTTLPELEVRQEGRSQFRESENGKITLKTSDVNKLQRSFGEADFINQIRLLSRVSSNGDYSSGLVIDGADPTQSIYLLDGAPVAFPYRFGGIFSLFNTNHFSGMQFQRQSSSSLPPRLGASFEMESATRFRPGIEGGVNIGMTASSLTVRGGVANKFSLSLSGRISYIDRLYKWLLEKDDEFLSFSFNDINATVAYKASSSDIIKGSLLLSTDNVGYDTHKLALNTVLKWRNQLYSISYDHTGKTNIRASLFRSVFTNNIRLIMPQMSLDGPTSLTTTGVSYSLYKNKINNRLCEWNTGVNFSDYKAIPQWATLMMNAATDKEVRHSESRPQNMICATGFGKAGLWIIPSRLKMTVETALGYYDCRSHTMARYSQFIFTPKLYFDLRVKEGKINVGASWLNQPLHQVGFSELGLASNFWIGAFKEAPMQKALSFTTEIFRKLPFWGLKTDVSLYWRKVYNSVEYQGQVLEVIDTDYNPFSKLIVSDGFNYGVSVEISRPFGNITGALIYSYGDGIRHSKQDHTEKWRSLYSEGNSFKCNLTWHEGRHWEVMASFCVKSGRPYTPVRAFYAIGGNIAMEYGERNSARLPNYQRLDLGASYYFSTGNRHSLKHIINLSLLNALGHRNVEMQYFVMNSENGDYSLKRLYSLYRFLPSFSYSIEF